MAPNDAVPDPSPSDSTAPAGSGGPGRVVADREQELALVEQVAAELAEVDRALARLDDGTYGTCEACGTALDDARLAELPTARWCAAHEPA